MKKLLYFNELPLYIKNHADGAELVYLDNNRYVLNNRATFYIKWLASLYFINLENYKKAVRKHLGYHYKIPVVLSSDTVFIQIYEEKNFDHVWVNYFQISQVVNEEKSLKIIFVDQSFITVNLNIKNFEKSVMKIKALLSFYKSNKHHIFNENFQKR